MLKPQQQKYQNLTFILNDYNLSDTKVRSLLVSVAEQEMKGNKTKPKRLGAVHSSQFSRNVIFLRIG